MKKTEKKQNLPLKLLENEQFRHTNVPKVQWNKQSSFTQWNHLDTMHSIVISGMTQFTGFRFVESKKLYFNWEHQCSTGKWIGFYFEWEIYLFGRLERRSWSTVEWTTFFDLFCFPNHWFISAMCIFVWVFNHMKQGTNQRVAATPCSH